MYSSIHSLKEGPRGPLPHALSPALICSVCSTCEKMDLPSSREACWTCPAAFWGWQKILEKERFLIRCFKGIHLKGSEEVVGGELQVAVHLCSPTGCLFPDTGSRAAKTVGRTMAGQPGDGGNCKGGSWLLDEMCWSPGWPGVLCLLLLLSHWLHGCLPPTRASRGPTLVMGSMERGLQRVKSSEQSMKMKPASLLAGHSLGI